MSARHHFLQHQLAPLSYPLHGTSAALLQDHPLDASPAPCRDERLGVPSASGMERLMNCPASFAMEQCATQPPAVQEDTASGTRIHAVLAGAAPASTLSASEQETLELCQAQALTLRHEFSDDFGALYVEQRLGLTTQGTVLEVQPQTAHAPFVFTGRADLVLVHGGTALVLDYKTGRNDVPTAGDNPQLAALAVLVAKRYSVPQVRVAIVQPWSGPPTVADYSVNALVLAESWLQHALLTAATATPEDARAGSWCQWCKAKAQCTVFKQQALQQIDVLHPLDLAPLDGEAQRHALFARAMELPPADLAASVRGLDMVKRFVAAIEAAARERATHDAEFQRHYTLREKKAHRTIADVGTVFARCHEHGVTAEQFTAACSVPLGEVRRLLKAATGTRGRALETLTTQVLTDALEQGRPSYELVAVGECSSGGCPA